jgi:outer membrane protein insertion porin family
VSVEESDTLSLSAEVGYGAFEQARVIVGVTEENIAGTGRSLRLEGKLAQKAESVRLFMTDPWTLGKENLLGVTTFYDLREEPSFDRKELGIGTNITRRQSQHFRNVYGYEYRNSDAKNININLPPADIEEGDNSYISELYLTNLYDSRDSVFLPTTGTWVRLRSEIAPKELASQLTFARVQGRIARYHPLSPMSLFAWTFQTGLIFPIQDTVDIPLQERFFNGGQNTVRSFRESELGPKDANGNPVGGETYTVASIELRRKLPWNFTGAVFLDAGNVSLQTADYLDFADFSFGVGPGLRWLLPIGPLRLDWGINPDPGPNEADWVVQFSVGVAF